MQNLSDKGIIWTKHALRSASEDNFAISDLAKNLNKVAELYAENPLQGSLANARDEKNKGIVKVGERYCTIIYIETKEIVKIITCWKSSWWEVTSYERENKK